MSRILLVEDDDRISRFLQLELRYEGYEVAIARDGRKGLELALTGPGFNLILLDIILPELNGLEVLRRIRQLVDVYIRYLIQKIDKGFSSKLIQTIRGVGYMIKESKEPS
jgi:two-component system response regulator ArlR